MTAIIDILKTELNSIEYADLVKSQNYPAIADLLNNRPSIPNPVPQANVPKIPTIEEVITLVKPQEVFAISETKTYDRVLDALRQKNLTLIIGNTQTLLAGGVLSQSSYDAIIAKLEETEPDPSYQSQIPGQSRAEDLGVYPVNASQVQEALN
jgi:hypothetical protein